MSTIFELFQHSVSQYPKKIALEAGEERFTYEELLNLVERLKIRLPIPVNSALRVGLIAERTSQTYALYLAILAMGAVVVPLNPKFPIKRNRIIAEAANVSFIVSPRSIIAANEYGEIPILQPIVVELKATFDTNTVQPIKIDSQALAYILFTSGSTGRPKGVPITHANLDAYMTRVLSRYSPGPGMRVTQLFDLTFDLSVFDMFTAWATGATLVVASRRDLFAPIRFVRDKGITHWLSVPSLITYSERIRSLSDKSMPNLRSSIFCGEPLTEVQLTAWQKAAPDSTVTNIYGPTEMTITCATYTVPINYKPTSINGTVPIGLPDDGCDWLLIDEGRINEEKGELCLRGAQRLRGYLDDTDNQGRFYITNTNTSDLVELGISSPVPEDAWLRTGDLVRLENEVLVHLGRLDQQIKIQGYRIEIGEIEAALRHSKHVLEAVVIANTETSATQLLAAVSGYNIELPQLLAGIRSILPPYMIPSKIQIFAELPRNANGKIDRNAVRQIFLSQ